MDGRFPLISRMSALFAQGAVAYCAAAALAGVIGVGLNLALIIVIRAVPSIEAFDSVTLWQSMTDGDRVFLIGGILLLILLIWLPIVLGARGVSGITFDLLAGLKPSPTKILIYMLRFLPSAVVYSFVFGLPVLVASVFFYFPGLLVGASFALVIPVGIYEGANLRQALKRGASLSQKVYGKILLTMVVSLALVAICVAIRVFLLDNLISGSYINMPPVRMTAVFVPALLVLILSNICFTLLYFEAIKHEAGSSSQNAAAASSDG